MSFKNEILARIGYEEIAEEVFGLLETNLIANIAEELTATDIAEQLVDAYEGILVDTAKEVVIEELSNLVDYDDIEDEFREVVSNKFI